jgi:hypothetical protein
MVKVMVNNFGMGSRQKVEREGLEKKNMDYF